MKINIGLSEQARSKIAEELKHLLADTYGIYLKTQNFHWNVKGAHFFELHLLFEKQYTEMAEAIDEIAERIQALGFGVEATFSAFKKNCCIAEEKRPSTGSQMVQQLLESHEALIRCARKGAQLAEKQGDAATVDLLGRRLGAHEKFAWMLRAMIC